MRKVHFGAVNKLCNVEERERKGGFTFALSHGMRLRV
jgi:hypothetical protein